MKVDRASLHITQCCCWLCFVRLWYCKCWNLLYRTSIQKKKCSLSSLSPRDSPFPSSYTHKSSITLNHMDSYAKAHSPTSSSFKSIFLRLSRVALYYSSELFFQSSFPRFYYDVTEILCILRYIFLLLIHILPSSVHHRARFSFVTANFEEIMGFDSLNQTEPITIHIQEDDPSSQSKPLLSFNPDPSKMSSSSKRSSTIIFTALTLLACIVVSAAFVFPFFFYSCPSPSSHNVACSLKKLEKQVVIMISCDGFRFGYQFKTPTPNIHRLIANGTEAEMGLIPVFPTLTFPNHYSIVTGLHPAYHGIINNYFVDPHTGEAFTTKNLNPKWWLGEPLWETVANHGLQASTNFWPGSEVKKGSWDCPEKFCAKYKRSVPFEDRVDTVLSYFDLPSSEIPVLMNLYLSEPDKQGHKLGPDAPQITEAVANIDSVIGRLIDGLEKRWIFEDVNIVLVGDHGMVGTCDKKMIFLDDLAPWVEIPEDWVQFHTPILSIHPPPSHAPSDIVAKMNEGLESGMVENGKYLKVYLKEDLPSRLHYVESDRIPPIIGLIEESYTVEQNRSKGTGCEGSHGYDNAFFSMRTIFIGHGPRFARGKKVPSFENVQIYNLVTSILNLNGAPNNGSSTFPGSVLLPSQ